jgi:4-amino-4-deoxy-L-arabinose transferase-like glycosyltransferase
MNNALAWIKGHSFLVLLISTVILRIVYLLWQNVPVLNQDESALLLNARFIAQTGRDEWQQLLPLTFRSFGDFKLPGYIYVTAFFGSIFGFSPLTVRLFSFLAGIGNIVVLYLLGKRLFSHSVGWWSALFLVFSPWSWHYGSVGFEANVGLFFFLCALLFALAKPLTGKASLAIIVCLLFGGLTYNSPLLLSPLIILTVVVWQGVKTREAQSLLSGLLATVMCLVLLTLPASLQKGGISVFSDPTLLSIYPAYRASFSGLLQTLIGNKYVFFSQEVILHFFQSFSWPFLVVQGGSNPWHTIPGAGHVHFLVPLLAALSLGLLFKGLWSKKTRAKSLLVIGLLLGSLVPAIITVDAPHATRSLFFFVMLTLLAGVGMNALLQNVQDRFQKKLVLIVFIYLGIAGTLFWWLPSRQLWRTDLVQDRRWPLGLPEALHQLPTDLQNIYVYDPHGVLYTVVANETEMSPLVFWETIQRSNPDTAGLVRVESLGRFRFVPEQPTGLTGHYLEPVSGEKWAIIDL